MGIFNKFLNLFNNNNNTSTIKHTQPDVQYGHYSDNNKPLAKTQLWKVSEELFTDKKYMESIETFFDYIKDDAIHNVNVVRNGSDIVFDLVQGSKIIKGTVTANGLQAKVNIAKMTTISVPVMRKVLEMNYNLYYSRFALHENILCMLMDTPLDTCNPNKMYYGLRELATNADKLDDLLVAEFNNLSSIETIHIEPISESHKELKYNYFIQWLTESINKTKAVNQDTFSGGISYVHLNCLQKIDYLIAPKGKLQNEIEKITNIYWNNNNEKTAVEINTQMRDAMQKLLTWDKEAVQKEMYKTIATFSYKSPADISKVNEVIANCQTNMVWYNENKYSDWAIEIQEYALTSVEFNYSMPKIITSFTKLFLHINCSTYFTDLGFTPPIYNIQNNTFDKEYIIQKIKKIEQIHNQKYPQNIIDYTLLNFDNLISFNTSYLTMIENLNLTLA